MKQRIAAVVAAGIAGGAAVRSMTHRWGATREEHAATLPGDELVAAPALIATRAVTVDAPPERVWAWLVQMGQNRGGMYSYDWLENLIGLHIHTTDEIRDEWQHLAVGDRIVLVPEGTPAMPAGYALPVAAVDAPRTLVLRQCPPEHPWDAVWSFHVRPLGGGRTRLISRSRSHRRPGSRGVADLVLDVVMDPVTWVMTRKMLLGIKERAEGPARPPASVPETPAVPEPPRRGSGRRLRHQLDADVERLGLVSTGADGAAERPVTEDDLRELPVPAQRYLRRMGVVGRPRDRAFRVRFRGQIRMRPDQAWMPFDAWQFNTSSPVTRLIRMRIDVAGIVPMFGTDTYVGRTGRMHGKVLGLVTVADGTGPEFDLGELVTYVNDAALLAPSMLLTAGTTWRPVDDRSFDLTFTDGGNAVTARLFVDDDGNLVDFRTDDRWYAGTDPPTRTPWSTPIGGWTSSPAGRPFPAAGSAIWHRPDGDFAYARGAFDPSTFEVDPTTGAKNAATRRRTVSV